MSNIEEVDFNQLCLDGDLFINYMTNFNFKGIFFIIILVLDSNSIKWLENVGFDHLFDHLMPLAGENYVAISKIFRKLTMNRINIICKYITQLNYINI